MHKHFGVSVEIYLADDSKIGKLFVLFMWYLMCVATKKCGGVGESSDYVGCYEDVSQLYE